MAKTTALEGEEVEETAVFRLSPWRRLLNLLRIWPWRAPLWVATILFLGGAVALVAFLGLTTSVLVWIFAAAAATALAGMFRALSQSEKSDQVSDLLLAAAEGNTDALLITGENEQVIYANAGFLRLFVMANSLDAIASIIAGGEKSEESFRRLRAAAASGVPAEAKLRVRVARGMMEWRRLTVQPIARRPKHTLWRAEDITARHEMETVRRREEQLLADFLDHLPAGFFSADADGHILHANATLAEWLGVSADEMQSGRMRFADFVLSSGDARADSDDGEGPAHGEVMLRATDGNGFPAILVQSRRERRGGGLVYTRSLVVRDVIWRDEGGVAGYALARRLHWLFDEAPVGIVLLDLHGEVMDCNRAFLRLLGLHPDAVIGRPLIERISKEDRSDVGVQLSKVVMGTTRAAHLEVRMPAAGERELMMSLFASRMEDDTGEVSGLIVHFIDTTEQKTLETQFVQAQKIQAVGQLAGGIAHDFNNLLTAMLGFCDLLLTRHGPGDPSFADIMQIRQNANRASNLVRQLLAFSRKQNLTPVELDITSALSDLSTLLRRLIGENVELRMEHGRDLGPVRVDPVQFDQVVINLAVNARDAMPSGGTLSIRTAQTVIEDPVQRGHELMPPGNYILVEVIDTGIGIPKESIGQIFEPFFSTKEKGAGTGLGLSTVYGIVRQTGGFIFVDSAPGDGSTFSIYLPQFDAEAAGLETDPDPQVEPEIETVEIEEVDLTGGGTVLLVEDEDAVRMFGARALRNKGYRVLEADSGESALDVINGSDEAIDLIISDVVMPGMDGHTFVRLVRQEIPDVKVILVSGYAEDAVAGDIQRDPTIHFMPKPFSLAELAGKAKEVLSTETV